LGWRVFNLERKLKCQKKELFLKGPEEAAAWDMYVAGLLVQNHDAPEEFGKWADAMILERRKRMAPPAQIVYSEQFS
jgi:hypothetical protein